MPKRRGSGQRSRAVRGAGEAIFSDLTRLLASREFESIDEVNAFLREQLKDGLPPFAAPETPGDKARSLVDEALAATSSKRRVALAREALSLSPDCADAYLVLAEEADTPAEARKLLSDGIGAGERALGAELDTLVAEGAMWLSIETRPYMRIRAAFAEHCWTMGDRQLAMKEMWELLRLNPGDNQGIRYLLLGCLLCAGSIEEIERLLALYPDDGAAAWQYDRALHLLRAEGPGASATRAMKSAVRANAHVPALLLGERPLPDEDPEYIGFGDESEAAAYALGALGRWVETPLALAWLASKSRLPRAGAPRRAKPK